VTPYLLDVNLLIALSLDNHMHHLASAEWFDEGNFEWATTPLTENGYLRLMTNPRMVGFTVSMTQAVNGLRELRAEAGFRFLSDDTSLADAAVDLRPLAGTKQVVDFHLVNLAARNGMRLATFDGALLRSLAEADRGHVFVIDS
jgi:uncharacterized protein